MFVDNVATQLMSMAAVVMTGGLIQCWTHPWRVMLANYLDALVAVGLILVLMGGTMLLDLEAAGVESSVTMFFMVIITCICLAFVLTVGYTLVLFLRPPMPYGIFLSHHKEGAAVLARWCKLILRDMTSDKVFYDSDNLSQLNTLFEICAFETKNVIVLLTEDTLQRIWCAGEIASAIGNNVHM
eukprot:3554043-Heterocapsa_arctica.AAC.1